MTKKIGELCSIFSGGDKPSSFSLVKKDGYCVPVYANAVENEGLLGYTNESRIESDSITISARGSGCGAVFYREKSFYPVVRLLALVPNRSIVYPKYLYYLLRNKRIKSFGSGQPQITIPQISEMVVDFNESLDEQKRIADFLWNIEKEIKTNKSIINELFSIISISYSYWFNQFEFPNENGDAYKANKGKMTFNEKIKQDIPFGWKVQSFAKNDLCTFIDPGVARFNKKNYLATANVDEFEFIDGDMISYDNRESRANMEPTLNSVWFAKMKSSIKHLFVSSQANWFVNKYILSTGFSGLQCTDLSFPFVASAIMQPYFEKKKDLLSHGATQQGVNNDDLESIIMICPTEEVLKKYKDHLGNLFEKINCIQERNQKLLSLLDFLCPLLLNGQAALENDK